jgi:alkanesulfonate monooxygenase SsuD/methylene tetrahydromethanopterin reductase-like flavin-dependent oxidoreductase (luciferase family)
VANIAASVDHISGGRLVLGLGGGVREYEHTAYGLEFHTVGTRLRRLDEACQVIKSLLSQERTDFEGRYYNLTDAPMAPKPLQDNVPLMIGGGGEKVTLRIAAQYADEWNVWGTVDLLKHKMAILDAHCERLGRPAEEVQRSAAVLVHLTDDQALVKRINGAPQARPSIAGNVSQLADIIASYAEAGVNEIIVPDFHLPPGVHASKTDFLDQFIQEVVPAGRNT